MVFWASRRAASSTGLQLGLGLEASIQWLGRRGLRWGALPQLLFGSGEVVSPPQVLVLHLGGNDMGLLTGKALIMQARHDFEIIWRTWPETWIVWSNMLPRRLWREGWNPKGLNRAVWKVNREIRLALAGHRGCVISHPAILPSRPELYRPDGVHLSDAGNDIFLQDLHEGLRDFIPGWWGKAT